MTPPPAADRPRPPGRAGRLAGGLLAWLWAAAFLLTWPGVAALVVLLALEGADPPATALAAASTVALLPMLVWFAGWSRRILCAEVVPVRMRALGGRRQWAAGPRWLDLASAEDPVADGPYLAAAAPLGEVHVEVTYQASVWADHRAYLQPGSEALRRLLEALARVAPPPADLGTAHVGAAVRRVRWLVTARRGAALSGLLGAVVLLPRLPAPAPRAWPGAAFVLLWAVGALVAYAVLKSCWKLWDYAQRRYEAAAAASTAGSAGSAGAGGAAGSAPTDVPAYAEFALLLEVLALAVTWPVAFALGWWSALLRWGTAVTALLDGGDPAQRPAALLIEETLAILVVFGVTGALGFLLSRPAVRDRLERRRHPPGPVAAAGLLLRQLPEAGLVVGDGHYRAETVAWDVCVPRLWRRGRPRRCSAPARMLLRNDAVVLDLRGGCMVDDRVAHVYGRRVYRAGGEPRGGRELRLAGGRDWRAFRRDLPELLERASPGRPAEITRSR